MSLSRIRGDGRRDTLNVSEEVVMPPDSLDCQTYPRELPPRCRLKEVAIGRAYMIRGCDARPSAQNHLAGHKLAVVFAQRSREGLVSRIAGVGAGRPFPTVTEELVDAFTVAPSPDAASLCRVDFLVAVIGSRRIPIPLPLGVGNLASVQRHQPRKS